MHEESLKTIPKLSKSSRKQQLKVYNETAPDSFKLTVPSTWNEWGSIQSHFPHGFLTNKHEMRALPQPVQLCAVI
jgi:hypothetical protein